MLFVLVKCSLENKISNLITANREFPVLSLVGRYKKKKGYTSSIRDMDSKGDGFSQEWRTERHEVFQRYVDSEVNSVGKKRNRNI